MNTQTSSRYKSYSTFSLKSNKHAIPDAKGFSSTNLKYMHRFYELYPLAFRPQVVDESSLQDIGENHPQLVDETECIFRIPWGHHRILMDKCGGNEEKALFYIRKTKDNILAQYSTNAVKVPIGISEYRITNFIQSEFKGTLPTIEELEQELNRK